MLTVRGTKKMVSNLRLMIKKCLAEAPASGYELVKKIDEKTGWKPSYGSMYPVLQTMKKKGLVSQKKDGRKIIYSLTAEGKKRLTNWESKKDDIFASMGEYMKIMGEILGQDLSSSQKVMKEYQKGNDPFAAIGEESMEMKNILLKMATDGRINKHSDEINKIFKDVTKKLKKLK